MDIINKNPKEKIIKTSLEETIRVSKWPSSPTPSTPSIIIILNKEIKEIKSNISKI
jgi:hypothetical protein